MTKLHDSNKISAAKHTKMLSNIADVIVIINNEGIITYKSPNIKKLFGWEPEELVGRNVWENIHLDDLDNVQHLYNSILNKQETTVSIECRYKCKDGTFKWIQFSGTNLLYDKDINGVLGSYHDISDRKKADITLQERETLYKALFQNLTSSSSLYKVITDDQGNPIDYEFLTVNPSYEKLIGLKEFQLVGKTLLEIFPDTEKVWLNTIKKVYQTGSPIKVENYSQEVNKYFELVVYRPQKEMIAMIGSDITERKLNEIEIIKAKENAEESNQLKSAFLQNMSHEVRTPLNAICGFSNLLIEPDLSLSDIEYYVSLINNGSKQLLSILDDILTMSSLETNQEKIIKESFCINKVIDELQEIFIQQLTKKNISIIIKKALPNSQSYISSDKTKITQILSNLINNALKFTIKGNVEFGYRIKGSYLEFYVKDTGIGIHPDLHEIIFERFRQADSSISRDYGGSGLGLSIAKGYIELLSGKIWVESEPDKGATFLFTVPYQPSSETAPIETTITELIDNCLTILVAEDEEVNFLFIKELLLKKNFNVIKAINGQEVIEICKTNRDIDLILMDIKMPLLDGYAAAKIIKEFNSEIPIIAQTAYSLNTEIEKYKDNFNDYITKPINPDTLFYAINHCMKK